MSFSKDELIFRFYSPDDVESIELIEMELFFDEHFEEFRQRCFQVLTILILTILLIFVNMTTVVKLLESPIPNIKFFQLSPGEYFTSTVQIAFSGGFTFSVPLLLSQGVSFLAPGLNKGERNTTTFLLVSSILLFSLGLCFAYWVLIPAALTFFINYNSQVIEPLWSFEKYFTFVSGLFFSTGVVFQLPIIQVILALLNIISSDQMFQLWKYILIVSTIIGAVLTPSADPFTQGLLSLALFLLYMGGCLTASRFTQGASKNNLKSRIL